CLYALSSRARNKLVVLMITWAVIHLCSQRDNPGAAELSRQDEAITDHVRTAWRYGVVIRFYVGEPYLVASDRVAILVKYDLLVNMCAFIEHPIRLHDAALE